MLTNESSRSSLDLIGRRRRRFLLAVVASAAIFIAGSSIAFEIGTHAGMTFEAYERSNLGAADRRLLRNLGFIGAYQTFLGDTNYDMQLSSGEERSRIRWTYEGQYIRHFAGEQSVFTIPGWLMTGAVREDDYTAALFGLIPSSPVQDDNFPDPPDRPINHFFDPINNRELSTPGVAFNQKSPDWAMGTVDVFSAPNVTDPDRRNHYSVADAKEAMYRALTLRGRNPDLSYSDFGPYSIEYQLIERNRYWATLFRALGDLSHLNQDMAQPQHTRNEPHNGFGDEAIENLASGHKSIIEEYLEFRAMGDIATTAGKKKTYTMNGQELPPEPLTFWLTGSAPPQFDTYLKFWTTAQSDSLRARRGLADFSNREFLTSPHMQSPNFESPSIAQLVDCALAPETLGYLPDGGIPLGQFRQRCGTIHDALSGTDVANVPLIAEGLTTRLWGLGGPYHTPPPEYMSAVLTKHNYDAIATHLIPRASVYSAGLLNYFFRGQLEISVPDNKVYAVVDHSLPSSNAPLDGGFRKIKAKVKNMTPDIVEGAAAFTQHMTGGRLEAVVKFRRNWVCYRPNLSGEYGSPNHSFNACRNPTEEIVTSTATRDASGNVVTSVNLQAQGNAQLFEFEFANPIPAEATDLYLQIVYRGQLGSEADAVVVATKDISEPTYYLIHNVTDYLVCVGGSYYRNNADGSLSPEARQAITNLGGNPNDPIVQDLVRPKEYSRVTFSIEDPVVPFGAPLIEKLNLQPREFVRFAFLTDIGENLGDPYTHATTIGDWVFTPNRQRPIAANQRVYNEAGTATADAYVQMHSFRGTLGPTFGFGYLSYPAYADCSNAPSVVGTSLDENPTIPTLVSLTTLHD